MYIFDCNNAGVILDFYEENYILDENSPIKFNLDTEFDESDNENPNSESTTSNQPNQPSNQSQQQQKDMPNQKNQQGNQKKTIKINKEKLINKLTDVIIFAGKNRKKIPKKKK